MDSHDFKVNGCLNKNSSNINVSTEPPLIKQEKTTSRTTEADIRSELESTTQNTETHLNMNTQVTEDKQRRKPRSIRNRYGTRNRSHTSGPYSSA
ncbi:unnamed protein product [Schistosoma mattheei]|uniref:Uncharacterized protein n=1 Tax=Schistosoma mattheei TaxID=31246 RepID=A0AA85ARN3_9TREM|nr:unnamed protein product [Schistosoma mattheei]